MRLAVLLGFCAVSVVYACNSVTTVPLDGPSGDAGSSGDASAATLDSSVAADAPNDVREGGRVALQIGGEGRIAATACAARTRPPGDAADAGATDAGSECSNDAECTAKPNGRCSVLKTTGAHRCTYDACDQDSDCPSGVCGCALGFAGQHVCLTNGNCRINSECPTGERCALSRPYVAVIVTGAEVVPKGTGFMTPFDETLGYFCTTPEDSCNADAGPGVCTFDGTAKRWGWGYAP